MSEILISDEEKDQWFMGDIALDRVKYERQIEELETRLREINRHTEATIKEVKAEHQKELEANKQEWRGSFNKIEDLQRNNAHLTKRLKMSREEAKEEAAREGYFEALSKQLAEAKRQDPARLITELDNARMMILIIHALHTSSHNVELNNLTCAMRQYAQDTLSLDIDHYDSGGPALQEMMIGHLLALFQPHKTVTGAWTKDADPSLAPFKGIIKVDNDD